MSARRMPVSRRDRPAKFPLSRATAVAAAIRIMQDEGLQRVTMRRLASELYTGPASLYVYVESMAELHGAMLDELLADLRLPDPDSVGDLWRVELVRLLTAYTRLLMDHPSLARSVLTLRPTGPHYLRLIDTVLGLLHVGGVPPAQAAWGVDLLLQHGTATAAEQGTRKEAVDADHEQNALVEAVHEAAEGSDHAYIARSTGDLFSGTGPQRLSWAFDVLITGMATVTTPPHGTTPA